MRRSVLLIALAACNNDVDPPWQLAHDRIIAARATPPAIMPGEHATLDLLAGFAEGPPVEKAPDFAQVVSPMSLADLVHPDSGTWVVDAPTAERLAAARTELRLKDTDPVPLVVGLGATWPTPVVTPDPNLNGFAATKTVLLGTSASNPSLDDLTINGVEPTSDDITVPLLGKTPLFVEADDEVDIVNWLTSAGTMHDFDLHSAYLTFEKDDPTDGQLAVVRRDKTGGVVWKFWSIHAE